MKWSEFKVSREYDCNYIQDLINTDCISDITDSELLRVIISNCTYE